MVAGRNQVSSSAQRPAAAGRRWRCRRRMEQIDSQWSLHGQTCSAAQPHPHTNVDHPWRTAPGRQGQNTTNALRDEVVLKRQRLPKRASVSAGSATRGRSSSFRELRINLMITCTAPIHLHVLKYCTFSPKQELLATEQTHVECRCGGIRWATGPESLGCPPMALGGVRRAWARRAPPRLAPAALVALATNDDDDDRHCFLSHPFAAARTLSHASMVLVAPADP